MDCRLRTLLMLVVLALMPWAAATTEAQHAPPYWSGLEPGPHAVGFRVTFAVDLSRAYGSSEIPLAGRPVRIMLWYPAEPTAATTPRLSFRSYVEIGTSDRRFEAYNDALTRRDLDVARRQFAEPADSLTERLLALEAAAHRNVSPATGPFPLVVHSLGRNNYQAESTVLWEYLASHGYVVAVIPQAGATPEDLGLAFTIEDLAVQLRDVEFTLGHVGGERFVDESRTALIGHSSGSVVGLLLASRNPALDALVSLDGSITTTDGRDLLARAAFDPAALTLPVLNLYAAGKRDLDLSVLDSLSTTDRFHVALGTGAPPYYATHFDFQNWPVFSVVTGVEDARGAHWRSPAAGRDFYVAACQLTRRFLDLVLKDDTTAAGYLLGEISLPRLGANLATFRHQLRSSHR